MEYGIRELSRLAGVSTRTLRYYDEIGLLKPSRVTEGGYRCYGPAEVAMLQQILFYRERGMELKTVQKLLYDKDFDMLKAMEDHLQALEAQQKETEALIATVKITIRHMKGDCDMSDQEKFRALKEKKVRENETAYGGEARHKYGEAAVNEANHKVMNLTQDEFARWQALEEEILCRLEAAVISGIRADSEEAKQIVALHRQWLTVTTPKCNPQMHRGIAALYIADRRFTDYYDRNVRGCAQLLHDAVQHWA